MKRLVLVVGIAVLALAAFGVSLLVASEAGEEVATLRTFAADGGAHDTRVWVVEYAGASWLRSGPTAGWLRRIEADPSVELIRAGPARRFRAVPVRDPATVERIHQLMRSKYGLADRWVSLVIDRSQSVAIRLEPAAS